MAEKNVALRKRQQIENANKKMFLWIAIAAAIVGMAAVVSVSLFQTMTFNQKVINKMNDTVGTLKENNKIVSQLKENVRVRNTDEALNATPRLEGTEPLSVVLDALPASANSSALGASLQQKLLKVDGVSIDSLTVDSITGVEDGSDGDSETEVNEISFQFTVSTNAGKPDALKQVLINMEKSIRVIDIQSLTVEQQNNKIMLSASGRAFYLPAATIELKDEAVSP